MNISLGHGVQQSGLSMYRSDEERYNDGDQDAHRHCTVPRQIRTYNCCTTQSLVAE